MSVTIELPTELESKLQARLNRDRQNVGAFVLEAVREKLSRCQTIDEICAPFADAVTACGIGDSEFDAVMAAAREEVVSAKSNGRS